MKIYLYNPQMVKRYSKASTDRCTLNANRVHAECQLFDDAECQPLCVQLRQLTKPKSIAVYSFVQIDWLSVRACLRESTQKD